MPQGSGRSRCARPGCRGWAMGPGVFCRRHDPLTEAAPSTEQPADQPVDQPMAPIKPATSGPGSVAHQLGSLYTSLMTAEERRRLEGEPESGLEGEIQVARLMVLRLLEQGDAAAVNRALLTVKALIAEHRRVTGDQATGIVAGIQQILDEMGLGEL